MGPFVAHIHSAPSGPNVIPAPRVPVGRLNNVTSPPGVISPIWSELALVNQTAPSGPFVNPSGWTPTGYSDTAPPVVMRPIDKLPSANQRAPSDPTTISPPSACANDGATPRFGTRYSVTFPAVVISPTEVLAGSRNHMAPSGPRTIPSGKLGPGSGIVTRDPDVVILPITPVWVPVAMKLPDIPVGYDVAVPLVVTRPMVERFVNQSAPSGPTVRS